MGSKKRHPHIEIYLEIGIVVVTLALVFVGSYGGLFDSTVFGGITGKYAQGFSAGSGYWQNAEIGVWDFHVFDDKVSVLLVNNLDDTVRIKTVRIDDVESDLDLLLGPGLDKEVLLAPVECKESGHDLGFVYEYKGKSYVFNGFEKKYPVCS